MPRRLLAALCLSSIVALGAAGAPVGGGSGGSIARASRAAELPASLSDRDFWRIAKESSEPDGYFRSDNLTSNELGFQYVVPELVRRARPGGVYLGVGPEQNFTYMAAVRPRLAVIFDIRRGNTLVQLMYKALFELSADRADFISMLFSKPRPAGLGPTSTAAELFSAFAGSATSDARYAQNLKAIEERLTRTHGLALTADDLGGIEYAYHTFYWNGFAVRASPTYADLMTATDAAGVSRSYLATEESFAFLKDLESRNLVIPVIGDFGGPKAIRAVGAYLKTLGASVSAFYLSNVEQYLVQDGKWTAFCQNVATLPLDQSSTFIRSTSGGMGGGGGRGPGFVSSLGAMAEEVKGCAAPRTP